MTGRRFLCAGVALAAAHAALFAALVSECRRADLAVRVSAPASAAALDVEANVPRGLERRMTVAGAGDLGPGLRRVEWSVRYRGGHQRRVGVTQLVGPFQDPARPPCAARLLVGQRLLDDGAAGPGTLAHIVATTIEAELAGFERWPLGAFRGVAETHARWMQVSEDPTAAPLLARVRRAGRLHPAPPAIDGFLRVGITLRFSRGDVPALVAIVPTIEGDRLELYSVVDATVAFESRLYQLLSSMLRGDRIASATAKGELDVALREALGPPPPVELPGGHSLRLAYCPDQPIEIVGGRYAALPLMLVPDAIRPDLAPVALGAAGQRAPLPDDVPLALELELDAVNGVLFELWSSGYLDARLDELGLAERFNRDPLVTGLLSLRLGRARLTLPPTATAGDGGLRLTAEAFLSIRDRARVTAARLYGAVGFALTGAERKTAVVARLRLADLALTCEPEPGLLAPCYADLVEHARGRGDDLHGELTRIFAARFDELVLGRSLAADGAPARFVIERAAATATLEAPTAVIRVDLFGGLTDP